MKLSKQILEAINRGINLALDDFDDQELLGQQTQVIKDQNITKDYLEYQNLLKLFKDFQLLDDGMRRFAELSIKLDIKYPVHTTNELKEIIKYICARDKELNLNWIDVSDIRSMVSLFHGSPFIGDISEWNVSNVTDMRNMFCMSKFNGNISKWDVHNVRWMGTMFYYSSFNKDISNWDVSKVEDMQSMFACSHFNKPIGDWDVSSVRNMSGMFCSNEHFNQDISKWDVHMVKTMNSMFSETNFNKPLNDWYVGNVEEMAYMFNQGLFNQPLDNWDVREVKTMKKMFCGACFHQDISMWNCEALIDAEGMFDNYNNLPIEFVPKKLQHWEKKWLGLRESFNFNKIKFALDDFDDEELIGQQTQTIKDQNRTKDYLDLLNNYAVDLGLPSGTLWCKYNLGVDPNKLEKWKDWFGDYYAWGEIEPNKNEYGTYKYTEENYKFTRGKLTIIKYSPEWDNLTQLLDEDDAAYQNMSLPLGFKANIPTKEQFEELIEYTKFKFHNLYDEDESVKGTGVILTSKINGNKIYFPFGSMKGLDNPFTGGYYWTSTLDNRSDHSAYYYSCGSNFHKVECEFNNRYYGMLIKPVINLNKQ